MSLDTGYARAMRVLLALWLWLLPSLAVAGPLRVYFFDVGQGDAALIVAPSGKTVLIDAGPPEAADALQARLESLLSAPLDLVILTHAHLDHLGGMARAVGVKGAQKVMLPSFEHPSPSYAALQAYLKAQGVTMTLPEAGVGMDLGGATLEVLGPAVPYLARTRSDAGANSLVLRLTVGTHHLLFMGDAEPETEAQLLERGVELSSDVLKAAHHGARESSTAAFLKAVHPRYAVVSVGAGNELGMPARAAVDRLAETGAQVFRTDLDGEVQLQIEADQLQVRSLRDRPSPMSPPIAAPERPTPVEALVPDRRSTDRPADKVRVLPESEHPVPAGSFVASSKAKLFHTPDCPSAARIKPANRVVFKTRAEAIASGREPARDCSP
jgi:beta-lactamase superfamily II metal-dependent hydrolase